MFNDFDLVTPNNKLSITEIELFINKKSVAENNMCMNTAQSGSGKFFVHKIGNSKTFKIVNRAGLDITCGTPFETFAGIRINCIGDTNQGSARSLYSLLGNDIEANLRSSKWTPQDILTLQSIDNSDIFKSPIRLESKEASYNSIYLKWSDISKNGEKEFKLVAQSSSCKKSKDGYVEILFNDLDIKKPAA